MLSSCEYTQHTSINMSSVVTFIQKQGNSGTNSGTNSINKEQ